MRKRFVFFLILLFQWTLYGQPLSRDTYLFVVNSNSKRNCPLYVDGCTVKNLSYKGNVLHFNLSVPKDMLVQQSVDDVRRYLSSRLIYHQENYLFTYLYDHLIDVSGGLSYDLQLVDQQKRPIDSSFSIFFTSGEYKTIINERKKTKPSDVKIWKARNEVRNYVRESNRQCPFAMDSYLTYSSVRDRNDRILFEILFNEHDGVNFSVVKNSRSVIEKKLVGVIKREKKLLLNCVTAGYGISWLYVDAKTQDSMDVFISKDRLKALYAQGENEKEATDAQMDAYMDSFVKNYVLINQATTDTTFGWISDGEYNDHILQFTMTTQKDSFEFEKTKEEMEVVRKLIALSFRLETEQILGEPDEYEGAIVTQAHFYEHLQGLRYYILEKGTHRGLELLFSKEEIRDVKVPDFGALTLYDQKMMYAKLLYTIDVYVKPKLPERVGNITIRNIQMIGSNMVVDAFLHRDVNTNTNDLKEILFRTFMLVYDYLWDDLRKLPLGIHFHAFTQQETNPLEIVVTPQEIAAIDDSNILSVEEALEILQNNVVENQERVQISKELVQDSLSLDKQYLTYHYTLQKDCGVGIKSYKENHFQYREILKANLMNLDVLGLDLLQICVLAERGLRYQIVDFKKKKVDFIFTVEDLKDILERR